VGHLTGFVDVESVLGSVVAIAPGGLSYDDRDVLGGLVDDVRDEFAHRALVALVARHDETDLVELGFVRHVVRGAMVLGEFEGATPGVDPVVRRGGPSDLAVAIELAAHDGPVDHVEWDETLRDPECSYFVAERDGAPIAHCVTFAAPYFIGRLPATVHVSSLIVEPGSRRAGVARALVSAALLEARTAGFRAVSANWRADSQPASAFWGRVGLVQTHVRVVRSAG
jgi:GNAT superfamily N-acetyltransferase